MSLIPYMIIRFVNMCRMLFGKLLGQLIMLSLECFLHKFPVCHQLFENFNSIPDPSSGMIRGQSPNPMGFLPSSGNM